MRYLTATRLESLSILRNVCAEDIASAIHCTGPASGAIRTSWHRNLQDLSWVSSQRPLTNFEPAMSNLIIYCRFPMVAGVRSVTTSGASRIDHHFPESPASSPLLVAHHPGKHSSLYMVSRPSNATQRRSGKLGHSSLRRASTPNITISYARATHSYVVHITLPPWPCRPLPPASSSPIARLVV